MWINNSNCLLSVWTNSTVGQITDHGNNFILDQSKLMDRLFGPLGALLLALFRIIKEIVVGEGEGEGEGKFER